MRLNKVRWILTTSDGYLRFLPAVLASFAEHVGAALDLLCFEKPRVPDWVNVYSLGRQESFGTAWAGPMIQFIDAMQDDYFCLLLGDYQVTKWSRSRFERTLEICRQQRLVPDKIDLSKDRSNWPHRTLAEDVILSEPNAIYRTSLQPALWRREYFQRFMQPNRSVWQFEWDGHQLACNDGGLIVGTRTGIMAVNNLAAGGRDRNGLLSIGRN